MHGKIFVEFKKFVEAEFPSVAWADIVSNADLRPTMYLTGGEYPDAELVGLLLASSRISGKSAEELLEKFGVFLSGSLISMYKTLVQPEWKTLDLIQHTEDHIHRVVRLRDPGAKPPQLKATRNSPSQVTLVYSSARKLCNLAVGIAKGVAMHYGEELKVSERTCMKKGASQCEIVLNV